LSSSTDGRRIVVGRIGRPQGVRGEVTVVPESDDPGRFAAGAALRAGDRDVVVRSSRPYRSGGLVVAFEGVADRDAAEALRGLLLTVPVAERRDLDEGEFWPEDLIGLEVVNPRGRGLGEVVDVVVGESQDRLVVATPSGEHVEVPFVADFVSDPEGGRLVVDAPQGLF
jgi:16S rRNA processing protein RimM